MVESASKNITSSAPKTAIKIGDTHYNIDFTKIPHLSAFAHSEQLAHPGVKELTHPKIPLFDVALKGIEMGYQECFRALGSDLAQYKILCETYDLLGVKVIDKSSQTRVPTGLRERSFETRADAAFKFVYLILCGEFEDLKEAKGRLYPSMLFVTSQPAFDPVIQGVVEKAYNDRFMVTYGSSDGYFNPHYHPSF